MKTRFDVLYGALLAVAFSAGPAAAQSDAQQRKLSAATTVVQHFSSGESDSIPIELLERARGIAVIPDIIRGGFIFGARRGRGLLVVRTDGGEWSNPAAVTLTGGSVGWQIGAESADVVLVFANDNSVRNIRRGKFTLGGDASAVAGPVGRHATMAVTFRAEVYGYTRSHGLFAGAAFEGMRLAIDAAASQRLYSDAGENLAFEPQSPATPPAVRDFLLSLAEAELDRGGATAGSEAEQASEQSAADESTAPEVKTFPLEGAP